MVNFSLSQTTALEILTTSLTPLISGEIGEDLAFYLTESQQTPSAVGLNVLLDEEDKVKVAGGFLVQVLPGAKEEEIARFEKRIQEMPAISTLLESDDHIEALPQGYLR